MHGAQRVVALHHRGHDDAEAEHVQHLFEAFVLLAHLGVDAPGRLDAADQVVAQPFLGQALGHLRLDGGQRLAAHHRLGGDAPGNDRMAERIQRPEAQVLQLGLDLVHAQALGDGGVDFQRLAGDAPARFHRHGVERAHVVQAVGQLDEDHAQVARHRQHHLAEALGGGFLAVAELQLVELGDAVHQFGHGGAEAGLDLAAGQRGVFQRVVQDGGAQGFGVQPQVGQDAGHGHGMGDVGLAALAGLAFVGAGAHFVGLADQLHLVRRQVVGQPFLQRGHGLRTRVRADIGQLRRRE